ncbi:MAG: NADH-quinone oxidoreductase subunit NuoE [Anaerolinea sp.]|nr:NADH-quinone oxidoreductase subunit NuoE [Anaerolinea sp.]
MIVLDADISVKVHKAVQDAIQKYGASDDELIPILIHINHDLGYLPSQALEELSVIFKKPKSKIFSVASFYGMLSTTPVGRHVIRFCESAPCHVVGGRVVFQALIDVLKINPGETSKDGKWTLLTTSCLGICAVGPAFIVDDDIYGNVAPAQVQTILARYE